MLPKATNSLGSAVSMTREEHIDEQLRTIGDFYSAKNVIRARKSGGSRALGKVGFPFPDLAALTIAIIAATTVATGNAQLFGQLITQQEVKYEQYTKHSNSTSFEIGQINNSIGSP